uniref:BZIP domain-containing protein n=1 Tax=Ditylenchus dipsaci TaxID=166011 RepID=A0A915CLM7_9BILA
MTSNGPLSVNGFMMDENTSAQLFAQQPSVSSTTTASEPDSSSVYSSNSSVESMRDRTHLTLDFKGMKPRTANHLVPADSTVSPLSLPKDLIDSILLSPEKFLNLPQSLLFVASAKQQAQQTIAETPTPTKFIYPKNVTKAQEIFAEGFQKALQKHSKVSFVLVDTHLAVPPGPPTLNPSPLLLSTSNTETANNTSTVTSTTPAPATTEVVTGPPKSVTETGSNKRKLTVSSQKKNLDLPTIVVVSTSGQPSPTSSLSSSSSTSSFSSSKKAKLEEKHLAAKEKTATELLGEIYNKLDPNNAQNYMDLFHHHQQSLNTNFMNNFASANNTNVNGNSAAQSMMQFSHSPPQQHQMAQQHHSPLPAHMIKQENPMANLFQSSMLPPQLNGSANSDFRSSSLRNCSSTASTSGSNGGGPIGYGSGSSFDMDDQERKKLERKRARNRQAASKCRQRKMERITELEQQVQIERQRASSLASDVDHLKRTIVELNHQLDRHRTAGCPISIPFKQFLN